MAAKRKRAKRRTKMQITRDAIAAIGGIDGIIERIEEGETERGIAEELGVTWRNYMRVKKELDVDEGRMKAARRRHAGVLVDRSAEYLEEVRAARDAGAKVNSTDVGLARAQSDNALKRAAAWDPDRFGRRQGTKVDVNLSLGGVFVQLMSDRSRRELKREDAGELAEGGEIVQVREGGDTKLLEAGGE